MVCSMSLSTIVRLNMCRIPLLQTRQNLPNMEQDLPAKKSLMRAERLRYGDEKVGVNESVDEKKDVQASTSCTL